MKPTIMCIDDEDNMLFALERLLEDDYEVIKVHSSKEAVAIYKKQGADIDVVLADIKMPEEDGLDSIGKIKEMNANAVCLILSGVSDILSDSRRKEYEGLIYSFLSKPWDDDELLEIIKDAVRYARELKLP